MNKNIKLCIYCGSLATERDHVIPRSLTAGRKWHGRGIASKTVWSCRECNQTLKDAAIFNIHDRAFFLLNKLSNLDPDRKQWLSGVARIEMR